LFSTVPRKESSAKIRVVSEGCKIDAGNLRFTFLTGVNPARSVEYLASLVTGQDFHDGRWERVPQGALTAIAMHADASADKAMNSFVESSQPESLRKQTVFWLGEARGASGFQTLKQLARNEKSTEVRSQITFALSLNRDPGAIDEMIRMAREDESTHVRGQALFWLAQKAGQKASGAITGAIENDPDTESEEEGRVCAEPDAARRRRSKTNSSGAEQQKSGSAEAGYVLAGTIERSTRAGILRENSFAIIAKAPAVSTVRLATPA